VSQEQENIALARRWFEELWNQGRFEIIDEMADTHAVGRGQMLHDAPIDLKQFREFAHHLRSAFPDFHVTIEDTIAEKDRVVLRWQADMTHSGQFLRYPATGKKVDISGITIFRLKEGKIVAGWDKWDQLGMLEQIGAVPEQNPKSSATD
jgi:steroid delta-isomerase-like uncharacterized protein